MARLLIGALILTILLQGGWGELLAAEMAQPAGITVVVAVDGEIAFGAPPVSLAITVGDVQNMGAATVLVEYDPALVTPTGCQRGSQFGFGLCNLEVDQDDDDTFDAVRFNVLALTGVTVGADAATPLVSIAWQASHESVIGASGSLTVTVETLTDTSGIPISAVAQNGTVTILPAPIFLMFLPQIRSRDRLKLDF